MPWETPTLREVRTIVRDNIRTSLPGSDAAVPNSVLRVISDAQGALCHLTLQYVDWLALQLLPDTAETEWLDRHGQIWLTNSDGSTGRKQATLATGTVLFDGTNGTLVPSGTRLTYQIDYETTADITIGVSGSEGPARALEAGTIGNILPGSQFGTPTLDGLTATAVTMGGGTDVESDEDLRGRILRRIRQPPMGGAAYDYEAWALAVPGVTRAWCAPNEQGIGTVTVRIMMDDLRADNGGFPLPEDIEEVTAYINSVRPVTVKDFWVVAPIPEPVHVHITYLDRDVSSTRAAIQESLLDMFWQRAVPGQTWYRAWTDEAIAQAVGVVAYTLQAEDKVMSGGGYMPVLGDISYGPGTYPSIEFGVSGAARAN